MAEEYVLGNFLDGLITHRNLPVNKGTDKVLRDLAGGSVEIEINAEALPSDLRENWKQGFKPTARYIALIDNEKALSDPTAVLGWGFINKAHAPVGKGYIRLQMASMNEYLATLPAISLWDGAIVEEDTPPGEEPVEPVFSASTWEGLMRTLMSIAFTPSPAGAPQVPSTVSGISPDSTGDKTIPNISDGTTFLSLLEETRDNESGVGIEWRFNPFFIDATHIGNAFVTGTQAAPHINEINTISIDLSEVSSEKISGFSTTIDSRELFNKVYMKYTKPGETEADQGLDEITAKWDTSDSEIPLMAKWINTAKEMTTEQAEALKTAYISDGKTGGLELGFTIEEKWDKSDWILNLGKMVTFTGVPSTISSGHTVTARCVGIEFSVQKGTVKATFMAPQTKYPVLPKKKKSQKAFQPAEKVGWTKDGSRGIVVPPSGGTYVPPPITAPEPIDTGWSNDGVFNPEDLWGSEGRDPFDLLPKKIVDPVFTEFKETTRSSSSYDGKSLIDPVSMTAHEGNRIYGLDSVSMSYATSYSNGNTVHYNGGFNKDTGKPITGIPNLYIKKTHLTPEGEIGEVITVGILPSSKIDAECFPDYVDNSNEYFDTSYHHGGHYSTIWYVDGRIYVGISYMIYSGSSPYWSFDNQKFFWSGKTVYFSASLNGRTGMIEGEWQKEDWKLPYFRLPHPMHITRAGKVVFFGQGATTHDRKHLNISYAAYEAGTPYKDNGYWLPTPGFVSIRIPQTQGSRSSMPPIASPWTDEFGSNYNGYLDTNDSDDYGNACLYKDFGNKSSNFEVFRGVNKSSATPMDDANKVGMMLLQPSSLSGLLFSDIQNGKISRAIQRPGGIDKNVSWNEVVISQNSNKQLLAPIRGSLFYTAAGKMELILINAETNIPTSAKPVEGLPWNNFAWDLNSTDAGFTPVTNFIQDYEPYSYHRQSRIFSYGGRLYICKLTTSGGTHNIVTRSMKIIEAA